MSLEDLARRDAAELLYRGLDAVVKDLPRVAEMATQEERAGVVAFLREWQNTMDDRITHDDLDYAIAVIERGEHRREEEG